MVANFLVSDPLFLKSGHSQVMMFLETSTKTNVILCSDKKGQGPKAFGGPRPSQKERFPASASHPALDHWTHT